MAIGLRERAENAARLCDADGRRALFAAVDRLVGAHHMGTAFKVGLIVPAGDGVPVGFSRKTYHDLNHAPPACRAINMMAGAARHRKSHVKHGFFTAIGGISRGVYTV